MRVLEPHQFNQIKKKKTKHPRKVPLSAVVIPGLVIILVLGYVTIGQSYFHKAAAPANPQEANGSEASKATPTKELELKTFTSDEFKKLYTAFAYPNTQPLTDYPTITGNPNADQRIYDIAERRGYKLSSVPVANIVKIDEPYLTEDDLLQQNAKLGWDGLMQAAQKESIPLQITSAYRTIDFQRTLFLREMRSAGVNEFGIADGYSDAAVERILERVAPPGFSRHHNGYTIDLACNGVGLYGFRNTTCYEWLSKNNFEVAKKNGWVPSYPDQTELQGPEPEPWEFIWVGTINLYE